MQPGIIDARARYRAAARRLRNTATHGRPPLQQFSALETPTRRPRPRYSLQTHIDMISSYQLFPPGEPPERPFKETHNFAPSTGRWPYNHFYRREVSQHQHKALHKSIAHFTTVTAARPPSIRPHTNLAAPKYIPSLSVSQPPGRGPVPGPDINYTWPREVLLEFVILVF